MLDSLLPSETLLQGSSNRQCGCSYDAEVASHLSSGIQDHGAGGMNSGDAWSSRDRQVNQQQRLQTESIK